MAWISIDAGTSVIKAVAFSSGGREIALARNTTTVLSPKPGFAEQEMNAVWKTVVSTTRDLLEKIHELGEEPIEGIAITSQGDGCWLVDADGNPTGNAILWNDSRAASIIEEWRATGIVEQAFHISGCVAFPGLSSAILQWLSQNDPRRCARSRWILSCNGWLFSKLTGQYIADLSDASNPFGAIGKEDYSPQLLSLYGLSDMAQMLPPIRKGDGLRALLTLQATEELGIRTQIPVVMAPYDIVTTAYGADAATPERACVILGTTICTESVTSSVNLHADPMGTTIFLGDSVYLRAMPTLTGCETLAWGTKILHCSGIDELDRLAAESPAGAQGLMFLPYLSPAGERAPFLDPGAHGSFLGMRFAHGRADMARAIYESIGFVIKECLQAIPSTPAEIRVCGGGARSHFLCQTIADVTGITTARTNDSEVGARGAFLFALANAKIHASIQSATAEHVLTAQQYHPSQQHGALYEEAFDLWLEQRALSVPQWHCMRRTHERFHLFRH